MIFSSHLCGSSHPPEALRQPSVFKSLLSLSDPRCFGGLYSDDFQIIICSSGVFSRSGLYSDVHSASPPGWLHCFSAVTCLHVAPNSPNGTCSASGFDHLVHDMTSLFPLLGLTLGITHNSILSKPSVNPVGCAFHTYSEPRHIHQPLLCHRLQPTILSWQDQFENRLCCHPPPSYHPADSLHMAESK